MRNAKIHRCRIAGCEVCKRKGGKPQAQPGRPLCNAQGCPECTVITAGHATAHPADPETRVGRLLKKLGFG